MTIMLLQKEYVCAKVTAPLLLIVMNVTGFFLQIHADSFYVIMGIYLIVSTYHLKL